MEETKGKQEIRGRRKGEEQVGEFDATEKKEIRHIANKTHTHRGRRTTRERVGRSNRMSQRGQKTSDGARSMRASKQIDRATNDTKGKRRSIERYNKKWRHGQARLAPKSPPFKPKDFRFFFLGGFFIFANRHRFGLIDNRERESVCVYIYINKCSHY